MMPFWLKSRRAPLIIGHRGSSAISPENTLTSFHQAVKDGADAIEMDIRITKDKEIIVIHDSRLERTTNGKGLVRNRTLAELKKLNAGSWFSESFASEKIPTLDEVFDLFGRKVGINIEIKREHFSRQRFEIVDRCCKLIEEFELENTVLISSFHSEFIKRVKFVKPEITTGLLYDPISHRAKRRVELAKSIGAKYLILNTRNMRKKIVEKAHAEDIFAGEYTIDTKGRFERSLRFGVNVLFTNNPSRLKTYLTQ